MLLSKCMASLSQLSQIVQDCDNCGMPGFCASIVLFFILGVELFDYVVDGGIKRSGYHVINDFIGIFPLIVFKLGQQVFVDVIQKNFTYFASLTFLWVD